MNGRGKGGKKVVSENRESDMVVLNSLACYQRRDLERCLNLCAARQKNMVGKDPEPREKEWGEKKKKKSQKIGRG